MRKAELVPVSTRLRRVARIEFLLVARPATHLLGRQIIGSSILFAASVVFADSTAVLRTAGFSGSLGSSKRLQGGVAKTVRRLPAKQIIGSAILSAVSIVVAYRKSKLPKLPKPPAKHD